MNRANRKNSTEAILGNSPGIEQVKTLIHQVAPSDITVLITGESGTGKELVAKALHNLSHRSNGPLITVNCGAIPEGIFESEVFGHEKGSFTSADQRRKGYFEMADRGTLFLDEIGEMPLPVQVKLLRVLETGKFPRVGGSTEISVDVRIVAATNRDLGLEVNRGGFRNDLFYRLKAITIPIPPLRDRPEDVITLVKHFAKMFAHRNGRPEPVIESDALNQLRGYYWQGNVRELKNFIESLVALNTENRITGEDVRRRKDTDQFHSNLPVLVSKTEEQSDRDLIYRTLLELKHEIDVVKGLVQQVLIENRHEVRQPFTVAEEIETFSYEESERNGALRNDSESEADNVKKHLSLDELECEQIKRTLYEFNGNRKLTAKALGISERTLYRKIRQYNL